MAGSDSFFSSVADQRVIPKPTCTVQTAGPRPPCHCSPLPAAVPWRRTVRGHLTQTGACWRCSPQDRTCRRAAKRTGDQSISPAGKNSSPREGSCGPGRGQEDALVSGLLPQASQGVLLGGGRGGDPEWAGGRRRVATPGGPPGAGVGSSKDRRS